MLQTERTICEKQTIRILAIPPISPTPTLLTLPIELQLHIISYLDGPSALAMSQINKRFRSIVPVQSPQSSVQKMVFLNAMETWQRNNAKYACKFCLKLRPAHTFADNQLYGARGKRGSECDRRVCLDCGFRQRIYQPGQPVVVNGREQILCCLCGERRRYGLYCMLCWRCESCFSKHSMPKIPFHTSLEQYIRQHGCPRCSHHLEDLGSPELESHVTIEELLFQRMKIAGSEKDLEEAACSWYGDYR